MHSKYLPFIIAIAVVPAILFVFTGWKEEKGNFEEEKTAIAIRKIGHEVLLLSGDSSSRVLPVKQISKGEYLIQFESGFSFVPDSLFALTNRIIQAHQLPAEYMVNVLECRTHEVVYGFALSGNRQNDVAPCNTRIQPQGCYAIKISFPVAAAAAPQKKLALYGGALMGAALLSLGIVGFYRKRKKTNAPADVPAGLVKNSGIRIGNYLFFKDQQCLVTEGEKIDLTSKEAELLFIFASHPNQIIDRARLQKEIWEDGGVIVSRSLDVFVSKLRKKLEKDPAVKLVNSHGKGYKLEIGGIDA